MLRLLGTRTLHLHSSRTFLASLSEMTLLALLRDEQQPEPTAGGLCTKEAGRAGEAPRGLS